jgi:cell division protein ZapA
MEPIDVKILDRDYRLAVPAQERSQLMDAVRVVDDKMRSIRDNGRVSGIDRIAIMAALQLAHELLDARTAAAGEGAAESIRRIRMMTRELDEEIKRQEDLF